MDSFNDFREQSSGFTSDQYITIHNPVLTETVKVKVNDLISNDGGGDNHKKYVALLSQSGTDAPVATVLENSLGNDITWSRTSAGIYSGTITGGFLETKTIILINNPNWNAAHTPAWVESTGEITMEVYQYDENNFDALNGTHIEIRVYP